MKDFSIVVLVIFLGLLMTCCYMLALVNAENTQSQQQQHISVLWVTMQSNRITSSSPVKQRLPNSVWNRNVWYSWVQVMIWWPRWHMLNTHTHTQTLQSLDSPTVSTHHRSSCRDFLRQAKLLGKTWKERERYRGKEGERQIVVHDKQKRIYLLWLFKRKKQSLLIFCEISTELTLHAVTNLACPFYTSEVRELSEFIVVPGVFLCDSVTLEI